MTAKVTSRFPKTPMAVKATDGVNFPYWSAYTASAVAERRMGLVIQQLKILAEASISMVNSQKQECVGTKNVSEVI
jgi:hypothetical protein